MVFKEINIERYDSDNNLKLDLKSIYSNPDSLFFYYAKSLDWRMKRKKKEFTEMVRNGKYRYPFYLTFFHGKVAYPVAYNKIKDIWYKSNKK